MFDSDLRPDAYFAAEITKVEDQPDGSVMVYGCPANPEQLDNDDQIADEAWLKKALPDWFHSYGNVREMHQPSAIGDAKKLDWKGGKPQIAAKVVDPGAAKKVRERVYKAFSVGVKKPETRYDPKAKSGRIVGGKIVEVSLVDRPSIPGSDIESFKDAVASGFLLCKAVGVNEWLDTQSGVVVADTLAAPLSTGGEMAEKSASAEPGWDRSDSAEDIKAKIADALNGPMPGMNARYWVMDIADDRALVQDWQAGDAGTAWIVPYTRTADGVEVALAQEWTLARQEWVEASKAAMPESAKRDFDRNVGGGVDRDKLPASDFVFPDERDFPVVKPGDVEDAVSSWGRYRGDHSFDEFKKNLTALAGRKGDAFVAALPAEWKEHDKAAAADDAKGVEASIDSAKEAHPEMDSEKTVDADAAKTDQGDAAKAAEIEKAADATAFCAKCGGVEKIADGHEEMAGKQRMLVGKDAAGHELRKYLGKAADADGDGDGDGDKGVDADAGKEADAAKTVDAEKTADTDAGKNAEVDAAKDGVETDVDAAAEAAEKTVDALAKVAQAGGEDALKAVLGEVLADALGIDLGKVGRKMASKRLERFNAAVDELKAVAAELAEATSPDAEKAAMAGADAARTRMVACLSDINQLARQIAAGDGTFDLDAAGHDGHDMGTADPLRISERIDENEKSPHPDLTKTVTEQVTKVVGPELAKSVAQEISGVMRPLVERLEQVEHTVRPASPPLLIAAERGHVLQGDTEKSARADEVLKADLEKRLAGVSDQDREALLATILESARGWRGR